MTVDYFREIFSSDKVKILANFVGLDEEESVDPSELGLEIYAYDQETRKEIFSERLNIENIRELYQHLNQISAIKEEDPSTKKPKFMEATEDLMTLLKGMEECDIKILEEVFKKYSHEEKIEGILTYLSDIELEDLRATIQLENYKESIEHLEELLEMERGGDIVRIIQSEEKKHLWEYKAKQPEKIFQNWIELNLWTLGTEYTNKLDKRRIGLTSDSDMIMLTPEGHIDLIELKRPQFELFKHDESHDSFFPSSELSKAIGQCLLYLKTLDTHKPGIESDYGVQVLAPRIKLIIGRQDKFNSDQLDALRVLNSNLNHIQILTYDNLLHNGKMIIKYYNSEEDDKEEIVEEWHHRSSLGTHESHVKGSL